MVNAEKLSLEQSESRWWLPLGCIIALVLLTRPFRGIFHDGHLYAVQALRWLDEAKLSDDIFFRYGNQDSFSVFTLIYGPAMQSLGIFPATLVLYLAGLVIWTGALFAMATALFQDCRNAVIATAFALCLQSGYGSIVLSYGEEFLTPRIFAEVFGFLAVTLALKSRGLYGFMAVLISLLLHPLVGVSFLALWIWLVSARKIWFFLCGAILFVLGAVLGAIGITPLDWIFEGVDPSWMRQIEKHAPLVLVSQWPIEIVLGWLPLPMLSLFLAWRHGTSTQRDVAGGVVAIGLGFTLLSFVLADILASRFFVGIQLWRATILLALFGNLFAYIALQRMTEHPRAKLLMKLAILLSAICFVSNLSPLPVGLMAIASAIAWFAEERVLWKMGLQWHIAYGLPFLASVAIALSLLVLEVQKIGIVPAFWVGLRLSVIGGVLVFLIFPSSRRRPKFEITALLAGLLAAIGLADLRTERQIFWAQGGTLPDELTQHLQGKTVYWENELVSLWIGVGMPQYYSCRQSGGMVFYRAQAEEIVRRASILRNLNTSDFVTNANSTCVSKADWSEQGPREAVQMQDVCTALPELDTMILKEELPDYTLASWTVPFSGDGMAEVIPASVRRGIRPQQTTYFVYSCETFR